MCALSAKVAAVGLRDICICFLKDYAGFTKPNDLLERLAKEFVEHAA